VGNIDFGSAGLNAAFFTLAHQGILEIIGRQDRTARMSRAERKSLRQHFSHVRLS